MRQPRSEHPRRAYRLACLLPLLLLLSILLPAVGQVPPPSGFGGSHFGAGLGAGQTDQPVVVSAELLLPSADQPAVLSITARMEPTWHIYSITQTGRGPIATRITLDPSNQYRLSRPFVPNVPPTEKIEPAFGNLLVQLHHGTVIWSAPLELAPGVDPRSLRIRGAVKVQPCYPDGCRSPTSLAFTAVVVQRPPGTGSNPPVLQASTPTKFDPNALDLTETADGVSMNAWLAIVGGFIGGFILNLMPCVLPVIGLKIMSFVEQAGHSRRKALMLNLWYSLGLASVFIVLATLAVTMELGWGEAFSSNAFLITLTSVVFVMGLSFLGVWEVPIPGFAGSSSAVKLTQQEGVSGAFAKGALTTILATPCGAPFLGPAIAWALGQEPWLIYAVFSAAALGMASPYLIVGAFPELLQFLPKPGPWMETLQQLLGFVLLGTVVFLLTSVSWELVVPTIGLLFGLWLACWVVGRSQMSTSAVTRLQGWCWGLAIGGMAWLATFNWLSDVMADRFRDKIDLAITRRMADVAGLTPETTGQPEASNPHDLPWQPFTRAGFEQLVQENKTVLIDFTADWCATCKTLEAAYLNTEEVRRKVDANGVVTLKADWTRTDPEVDAMLRLLQAKTVPVIAIFPAGSPNRPIRFIGGYTQGSILKALDDAGPSRSP